jgi:acyl-CoA synthetase (AMP-forming)/AMP-acid ligase II
MLDQTRAVIASHRAGAGVTLGPQPLRPPNRRAHTHPKPARRRPRRCPRCYRCCHAITQIPRIWCRHIVPQRYVASPPSPIRASLQIFYLAESTRSETALAGPALEIEATADANQVMYLPFTSGTTGEPKGVMHSDNTLLATARMMVRDWRLGRTVLYTLSPLSHNLGLGALITALAGGGELVLHDLQRGERLVNRLEETGAVFLFGVPTHAIDLHCHGNSLGVSNRLGCRHDSALLSPSSLPARDYPARDLTVSSLHPELPRCRGPACRARARYLL